MPCPKCQCKTVFRTAIAETVNVKYECAACGHKWTGKSKVILIDKKTTRSNASSFSLPW